MKNLGNVFELRNQNGELITVNKLSKSLIYKNINGATSINIRMNDNNFSFDRIDYKLICIVEETSDEYMINESCMSKKEMAQDIHDFFNNLNIEV